MIICFANCESDFNAINCRSWMLLSLSMMTAEHEETFAVLTCVCSSINSAM